MINKKGMSDFLYVKRILFLLLLLFTAACSVLRKDRFPDLTPGKDLYRDEGTDDSSGIAGIPWQELFTDPHLQEIINTALTNNNDLRVARARMSRAEAALLQARLEFFPSLSANFNASFQSKNPGGFGVPESYQLLANTSWETGIWGRYRSLKRAALASFEQSRAYELAVRTELIAMIAMNYYTLLGLDRKLEITEMTLDRRIRNEEAMKVMKENDIITGADLVLSQANRYSAEVTIPDLKQQIYETENSLKLLMGMEPGPIERGNLDEQSLPDELSTGVPIMLLSNRPDVLQAEYRLRAAFEMIRVAKSYFYPSLRINASWGIAATSISGLLSSPLTVWNILGGLTQPIFSAGLNRQRLVAARADQEEALATFDKTLLNAGSEVANAMHAYQTATEKISIRSKQIEYLEKSVEYTNELLKYSNTTNYTDVLTAEVNLLSAQLNSVNDKLQQMQSIVTLYQSLGGGWK